MDIPKKAGAQHRSQRDENETDEEIIAEWQRRMPKFGVTKESSADEQKVALLWALLASYLPEDVKSIEKWFVHHVEYTLASDRTNLTPFKAFQALAFHVRDRLTERWKDTQVYFREKQCKRVAYISMEYLLGRSLQNAVVNLGLEDNIGQALKNLGYLLEDLYDQEQDAGLGNGGLGRLAACFLDSLATLDLPAWGYGLRYKYGMFYQQIRNNQQVEFPDYWLVHGNPWEIERLDIVHPVRFRGTVTEKDDGQGNKKIVWENAEKVLAVAYDTPIPGYDTYNTLNMRLWSARPSKEFDLERFNRGDFYKSVEDKQHSERITSVLYPNDNTYEGKELRVKQQYFLVSATIQDLIRRFKSHTRRPLSELPEHIAVQLNDTHPTLAICELMRILTDDEGMSWKQAWDITTRVFAYTNHTVLPEALEKWSVDLLDNLLPRHLRIIYDINFIFLQQIEEKWPGDIDKLRRMSIIEEGSPRMIRMANLAIIGSHAVNGVAEIHSELLKTSVFPDFFALWPHKFLNMTNGVTPRRWIHQANPSLSMVITAWLRTPNWVLNLDLISGLKLYADNLNLHKQWNMVKRSNKERLVRWIKANIGITVSVDAMFDVQVKRIHEYKRQLLNILYVIHRYHTLKQMSKDQRSKMVPRVTIFGGKAAPGYFMAKLIIRLINEVGQVINNDPEIGDLFKVVFIPNYCVSLAEVIVPASDISQHISTAGMEASGTSNMKFTMNGCLIIGTLDGANVEIHREVGDDNIFIFGTRAEDVEDKRKLVREQAVDVDPRMTQVFELIEAGTFGDASIFEPILRALKNGNDYYLLSVDFPLYLDAQEKVDAAYKNSFEWTKKSILCTASSAPFSSDRTIREYADKIWGIKPVRRPGPVAVSVERLSHSGIMPTGLLSPSAAPSDGLIALERMTPTERRGIVMPKFTGHHTSSQSTSTESDFF